MFSSTATGKHKCRCYCQHSFAIAGARACEKTKRGKKLVVGNVVFFLGEAQILHLMQWTHGRRICKCKETSVYCKLV